MNKQQLMEAYQQIRARTLELCQPLAIEDYVIQGMDDVSPPKWHLAHTTWFFETFILQPYVKGYSVFHPQFQFLFNSYYQQIGLPYPRTRRGVLARPTVETIMQYRAHVDQRLLAYLEKISMEDFLIIAPIFRVGLHHEQQHQELLLMDIKYNFSLHPDFPVYAGRNVPAVNASSTLQFDELPGGIIKIGHQGRDFCFDNELPAHQQLLRPYKIARRLVTNGEYLNFIEAGGYQQSNWWLADGWDIIQQRQWQAPLYWHFIEGQWYEFTLQGLQPLALHDPVVHISFYEAEAFARFSQARLPTEIEWEHYAATFYQRGEDNFLETKLYHPRGASTALERPQQLLGDVWEWTASAYGAYPGYKPLNGALGEYNGKFMSNQLVLRGGSCVTPQSHARLTYRNFFQPDKRWQFSGIRLANEA